MGTIKNMETGEVREISDEEFQDVLNNMRNGAGSGFITQKIKMSDGSEKQMAIWGGYELDGYDRTLNVFMNNSDIGSFVKIITENKVDVEDIDDPCEKELGYQMTIDFLDVAITGIMRKGQGKLSCEMYVRDERKSCSSVINECTGELELDADGKLNIDEETLKGNKFVPYVVAYIGARNYLLKEGVVQKLYDMYDEATGVVLRVSKDGEISYKIVNGMERPDLPCNVLLFGEQVCRPYIDELAGLKSSGIRPHFNSNNHSIENTQKPKKDDDLLKTKRQEHTNVWGQNASIRDHAMKMVSRTIENRQAVLKEQEEYEKKKEEYATLLKQLEETTNVNELEKLLIKLDKIVPFEDSKERYDYYRNLLEEKKEEEKKNEQYDIAVNKLNLNNANDVYEAKRLFEKLGNWRDSEILILKCDEKIQKFKEEKEKAQKEEEERKKRARKKVWIGVISASLIIIALICCKMGIDYKNNKKIALLTNQLNEQLMGQKFYYITNTGEPDEIITFSDDVNVSVQSNYDVHTKNYSFDLKKEWKVTSIDETEASIQIDRDDLTIYLNEDGTIDRIVNASRIFKQISEEEYNAIIEAYTEKIIEQENEEKYQEAMEELEYVDKTSLTIDARIDYAVKAYNLFKELGDYKDSKSKCNTAAIFYELYLFSTYYTRGDDFFEANKKAFKSVSGSKLEKEIVGTWNCYKEAHEDSEKYGFVNSHTFSYTVHKERNKKEYVETNGGQWLVEKNVLKCKSSDIKNAPWSEYKAKRVLDGDKKILVFYYEGRILRGKTAFVLVEE